jgi:hypothetical protein
VAGEPEITGARFDASTLMRKVGSDTLVLPSLTLIAMPL